MDVVKAQDTYALMLTEAEWYDTDEAGKVYWQLKAMLGSREAGARFVAIMVKPDDLFPRIDKQTRVWGHTYPLKIEDELHVEFMDICKRYIAPGKMSLAEVRAAAERAFK